MPDKPYQKMRSGMAIIIPEDTWRELVSELGWQLILTGVYDATDKIESDVAREVILQVQHLLELAIAERKQNYGG